MKPDSSFPPFYPDAIPLWLYPDLFNETIEIAYRGWWFVGLYLLSALLNMLLIFGPLAIYEAMGGGRILTLLALWLIFSIPLGVGLGLLIWREFNRQRRKATENGSIHG